MTSPRRRRARAAAVLLVGLLVGPLTASSALGRAAPAGRDPATASPAPERPRDPVGLVSDINTGTAGSVVDASIALGDQLLLSLGDGSRGRELWRTDGSPSGTRLVADINPGRGPYGKLLNSAPRGFTRVGDQVYFFANDRTHGVELWRTDGTRAGTRRVSDVPGRFSVYAYSTAVIDRTLYFVAEVPRHGRELWRTDGSAVGVAMVADIDPGPESSLPDELTVLDGRVLFAADDGVHGKELWSSDGTAAGTALMADVRPLSAEPDGYAIGSRPSHLTVVGPTVYFGADVDGDFSDHLWSTDGTAAGTRSVRNVTPVGDVVLEGLTPLHDRLVYLTYDDRDGVLGRARLWSAAGGRTQTLGDVRAEEISSDPVGGALLLGVTARQGGNELWRTDGTPAGTRPVEQLVPGPAGSFPADFTRVGSRLLFSAGQGDQRGIWSSDGTARGTRRVGVVDTDGGLPSSGTYDTGPHDLVAAGGALFFELSDEVYGNEIWSTAPAAGAIRRLDNLTRPRVVGRREVGSVLTVAPGRWTPAAGLRRSYRWYVDGRADLRASRTFRLSAAEAGSVIRVRELVAKPGWRTQISYSVPTRPIPR